LADTALHACPALFTPPRGTHVHRLNRRFDDIRRQRIGISHDLGEAGAVDLRDLEMLSLRLGDEGWIVHGGVEGAPERRDPLCWHLRGRQSDGPSPAAPRTTRGVSAFARPPR